MLATLQQPFTTVWGLSNGLLPVRRQAINVCNVSLVVIKIQGILFIYCNWHKVHFHCFPNAFYKIKYM